MGSTFWLPRFNSLLRSFFMVVMEFPGMWCVRLFVCYRSVLTGVPHVSYSGMCFFLEGSVLPRSVPSACLVSGSFTFSQMTACSGIISLASYPHLSVWVRRNSVDQNDTPAALSCNCLLIYPDFELCEYRDYVFFYLCVWYKVVTYTLMG